MRRLVGGFFLGVGLAADPSTFSAESRPCRLGPRQGIVAREKQLKGHSQEAV
jgi:hypothetical protein